MATDNMMLKLLSAGPKPQIRGAFESTSTAGPESGQFARLLELARDGALSSNRPVTLSESAGSVRLSEDQLASLSLAADRAEAAGIRTAIVLLDDQAVILDVPTRSITGPATLEGAQIGGVFGGVDGVINLAVESKTFSSQTDGLQLSPAGAGLPSNSALLKILAAHDAAA